MKRVIHPLAGYAIFVGNLLLALVDGHVLADERATTGERLKFVDFDLELPRGLDADDFYVPVENPMSKDKVELGRALFFDVRLSVDNTVSCATCHAPQNAFTDNRRVSRGVGSQAGRRNAPTIINRAFSREQFWDGRAGSLEEQTKLPLTGLKEMGNPDHESVVKKVSTIKGYKRWFKRVFDRDVHIGDIAKAIAAFERTVVSGNSKVDEFNAGNQKAITQSEKRGFEIFKGKARCTQCHSGANFTDEKYHNLGIDWDGVFVDLGRYRVTKNGDDIGAFKTPTLREIVHTAPYMHNGTFATLQETVDFYNNGGILNPFLDNELRRPDRTLEQVLEYYEKGKEERKGPPPSSKLMRLNLSEQEREDLVTFLKALSGQGWQHIQPPASFPE